LRAAFPAKFSNFSKGGNLRDITSVLVSDLSRENAMKYGMFGNDEAKFSKEGD
jgi:hypothetical protein